ncbi:OLC1v1009167C2 [Oldenlandia corymbosa var. corymbosa]|uniref:OLC1v1009167C2 n=1 Tax=Oldenlandia corymbosa var. corymbosa TaxID=529605 RepID=A0AAV1DQS1_OLDCO|nr:OLC1v1009167C2 [Oldenlandia corymbosa var. corymbosa]
MLAHQMFLFLLHLILEVICFGFLVTVSNVLHYLPATTAVWCSLVFGAFIMQDKDLKEYNPSGSTTSKFINCSHHLCELGSRCRDPNQPCPYIVNYETKDTSTSGFLVEDILHLAPVSSNKSNKFVRAPVVIGCGSKQTGTYLEGTAPDGVMGLGLGNISVPHFLAKAGLVRNSFSLCFDEDSDGRIYFGDQGIASQNTTPFLALDDQNRYIVGVKACCVGTSCLEQTDIKVLVDSGTSFTYLPSSAYEKVVGEFDRQIRATKTRFDGYPWDYCYKSSSLAAATKITLSLKFDANNSFVVFNPLISHYDSEGLNGFCLAIQSIDDNVGTIGQNFMTGYRMVFDGENMKLGWSHSDCQDLADNKAPPVTSSNVTSPGSLPTEQQSSPNHRTPPAESIMPSIATSILMGQRHSCFIEFLFPFGLIACMFTWIF